MPDRDRPAQTDFIDIQQIADEIRNRIEQRFPTPVTGVTTATSASTQSPAPLRGRIPVPQPLEIHTPQTDEFLQQSSDGHLLVGQMPPTPATFRGGIGRFFVAGTRRALFWYTPQVQRFQRAVANAIGEQMSALCEATKRMNALQVSVARISHQVDATERIPMLERQVSELSRTSQSQLAAAHVEFERRLQEVKQELDETRAALKMEVQAREARQQLQAELNELRKALNGIRAETRAIAPLKAKVLIQNHRIDLIARQVRGISPHISTDPPMESEDSMPDQLYVDFEHLFRGERDDIKQRVSPYVPRLKELGIGTAAMPVVDLGCGRGEWLEVLMENGISAVGVDSNCAMVEESKQRHLMVHLGDAVEFLQNLPSESQGAVTGFHIVEHLQTDRLIQLFDETARVLKPGGIAIFETPNPANMFVSALTFYLDPTHRSPLPAPLLQFLVESRGLGSSEIIYLHSYPESYRIQSTTEHEIAEFLNQHFYGPQDYALISKKL